MNIQYKNFCEFCETQGRTINWTSAVLTPIPNSSNFSVVNSDGSILSIQPDSSISSRPSGTTPGSYETFSVNPNLNILHVNPNGVPYALAYRGQ